ncbi:Uncharacterised protein [uncultured Clostridium sp.]|nr:Uncharacterised protein [uncultured Clostridium sp.]SCI98261.1 Uncharacterised protein [uncultured Clostridium sp.]
MKKKFVLITVLLLSFIITNSCIVLAEQSRSTVPVLIKNLQARDELVGLFNEAKRIRSNISTININTVNAKDKATEIKKQINFYLTEISSLEKSLSDFDKKYANSQSDLLFSEQIKSILNAYKMSLNQQLNLLDALVNNDFDASKLFYSEYLIYIYYYLNLGDQTMAYMNTFYNLQ